MNTSKGSFLSRSKVSFYRLVAVATVCTTVTSCVAPVKRMDLTDAKSSPNSSLYSESTLDSYETGAVANGAQRILVDPSGSPFGVELAERADSNTLVLTFPKGTLPKYTTEKLSNPPRVVIDLQKISVASNKTFDTKDAGVIERVRIGSHPGKTRIVLDLPESQPADYIVEPGTASESGMKTLNFVINSGSVQAKSAPAIAENEIAALKNSNADDVAESELIVDDATASSKKDLPVAGAELALNNLMATTTPPEEVGGRPLLEKVELQAVTSTENMLFIKGKRFEKVALQKTAPSEYVLKIPEAQLAEAADTTLLASANAGVIRSVRPVVKGKDVWLRIFAQPNISLDATSTKTSITVAAQSSVDLPAAARAQVSLEKVSGKSEVTDAEVSALLGDQPKYTGRLISLDLQDTDIDNALRIIAEVSNLNIIASDDVQGKVTLRLIDVPWDQALDVILKTNGLDKVQEGNVVRIAPVEKLRTEREGLKQARQAEEELEPLQVRYVRISYAKAAELKTLVESVISERGSVAYDERTNQLIIKDIRKGIVNVAELIAKLDLRTPQVLLETQIVEASRTLLRELGSEFGFTMVRSPATGNATGYNFPNSISMGGSAVPGQVGNTTASSFPAAIGTSGGSAVSLLLDSADATRSISARLSALENEGRARIISRPAVATTNNKQAIIKSVEKIRIKIPQGGLSVATGQGAQASGSNSTATETVEVGIVLEVTPQASPDYYVLLDINAKSSTLGSTVVDGIPSEVERSATSSVLVSSGQTFAMGGIYKIRDNESLAGIPFLKDVPVLGHLFRRSRIDNGDEELLFFITPRVIEGSFDDAAMKM